MKVKRAVAALLSIVLCFGLCNPALAANSLDVTYEATLDKATINQSSDAQEVVLTVTTNKEITLAGTGMDVYCDAGLELVKIENDALGFSASHVNILKDKVSGKVNWVADDAENTTTTLLVKVTVAVPANTAAGEYKIGIKALEISQDYGDTTWEKDGEAFATLTISGGVTPPVHTCDVTTLTKVDAKAATCTEDGNIEYWTCTCGKLYKDANATTEITKEDTVIKAAHTGLTFYPAKEPTCTAAGCIAYWFCTGCEKRYSDNNGVPGAETTLEAVVRPAIDHSWELVIGGYEDDAPNHTIKCSACGKTKDEAHADRPGDVNNEWKSDKDNHWHEFACGTIMDKAEHTWNDGEVTTPATCTVAGVKTFTCTVCQETKTEPIDATGHSYETTWTTDGTSHWHKCANCDEITDKADHIFDTDDCAKNRTCNECGYVKPAGEHSWDGGVVTKEATCTETGEKRFTCTVCPATKTETIPTTNHQYDQSKWENDETNHWRQCAVCGYVINKAAHDWSLTSETPATCTKDGKKGSICMVCGRTKTETIDALGHSMTKTDAKAATCTEPGNSEYYTCGNCGKFFSDAAGKNEIDKDSWVKNALGHDFTGAWVNTDAAGHYHKCSRCDATDEVIKHTYSGKPCTEADNCTVCGFAKAPGVHAWGTAEYQWRDDNQGCTATVKCTNCEAVETNAAIISISTTPATCTVDGKTVYTATFSSNLFTTQTKEVTIKATGHTVVEDAAKAATCTETGLTAGKHCSVCNEVLVAQTVIPALGHKLTKTTAKAATCTEAGNNEYWTCSVCKKVFKADKTTETTVAAEMLTALGHKMTKTDAVTPTCAAEGNNAYYTCGTCKKVFKDEQGTTLTTVAAEKLAKNPANHTGETEQRGAVAASCMTAGRTADIYCKGCGEKLSKDGDGNGEIIPPTGIHNYVDGVCTTCGNKQPVDNATIKADIDDIVADVVDAVKALEEEINQASDAAKKILEKLLGYVNSNSRSKLQGVYGVTMSVNGKDLDEKGETLADSQNVTIAISEETYNALKSGAKIVESYLDKDGNAQTREVKATLNKTADGGYTVSFTSDKTAAYGLMTQTSSGGSSSGGSYTSGKTFTTDLPAGSITSVSVNGKKLDSKYYVINGSDVTLTDAYLATLKAGKYTIRIENATHVSTGTFTITADGALSSPKTADAGIALYAMLAVSSLMGTAVVSKKRRKA